MSNNTNSSGENRTYFTSSGETIREHCHFLCTGKPPRLEWLRETFLKDRIDNFGRLKVDENLRIKGHRNIFVVGDIIDIKELKQGYSAQKHALVAAKNLKLLMSGGKESKLSIYEPRYLLRSSFR
ncbi:hypothetical protein KY290_008611 [Solanum tuberosum]|uniref:FAD/NAD(P)-binding domain-containing protein n=1 Tax=Solanum tuberosum TaxID=4113 RepID=A0ABQ7W9E5_SOLTU|nr:hypothetical protein KY290_008611 [Solanum tuberosum]